MSNAGVSVLNMYQSQTNSPTTLGVPSGGFGSRGKNSHIRNIAVPGNTGHGSQQSVSTPRTARGHLLANLRTAPKTPVSTPTTGHLNEAAGNIDNRFANFPRTSTFAPKTARGLGLNSANVNTPGSASPQLPTPPASSPMFDYGVQNMTNQLYNMSFYELALQQQRLQQQLLAAQQAQQQLEALQAAQSPANYTATPPMSPYVNNGGNGTPNYYHVYNPNTNQYGVYMVPQAQQQQQQMYTPTYQSGLQQQQEYSPPSPEQMGSQSNSSRSTSRSRSPPKLSPVHEGSAQNGLQPPVGSLPFRRGHRKTSSLSNCLNINTVDLDNASGPKTAVPKLGNLPTTPMTATFAPGHASGTHPTRQPRGPPPLDEITAKPTSKIEGSKNFVSRQRRRAVFKLVSAGIERRGNAPARSASGTGTGTMTPVSENEASYVFEDHEGSVGSSLSGRQSLQSLRSVGEVSVSGDESAGGRFVEVRKVPGGLKPQGIFEAAEKRKSALF